jgi:hypothetical protein
MSFFISCYYYYALILILSISRAGRPLLRVALFIAFAGGGGGRGEEVHALCRADQHDG